MTKNDSTDLASAIDSRFAPVEKCLDLIESALSSGDSKPSITEKASVTKARAHLIKLASTRMTNRSVGSNILSTEDEEFSDFFLDSFTSKAFLEELDALRRAEGTKMTEDDFATLAQSIRDFGLSIPATDRDIFKQSVSESSA